MQFVCALALLCASVLPARAAEAPYCPPGQAPQFVFGFAALKAQLGPIMGEPLECEHANAENGDTLQQTSTGLSFYPKATNTPTFTDGWHHWALTERGLVYWTGSSIDPAPDARPVPAPAEAHPQIVEVRILDNRFEPVTIAVPAGATVRWANEGQVEHTVTADDQRFDSGLLLAGETYTRVFDEPGTYGYYCVVHGTPGSGEFGTVVVEAR